MEIIVHQFNNKSYYINADARFSHLNKFKSFNEVKELALDILQSHLYKLKHDLLEQLNKIAQNEFKKPLYICKCAERMTVFEVEITRNGKTIKEKRAVFVKKGVNLYLGLQIKDIKPEGFSSLDEIKNVLSEIEEDMLAIYDETDFDQSSQSYGIAKTIKKEQYGRIALNTNESYVLCPKKAYSRLHFLILLISRKDNGDFINIDNKMKGYNMVNAFLKSYGLDEVDLEPFISKNVEKTIRHIESGSKEMEALIKITNQIQLKKKTLKSETEITPKKERKHSRERKRKKEIAELKMSPTWNDWKQKVLTYFANENDIDESDIEDTIEIKEDKEPEGYIQIEFQSMEFIVFNTYENAEKYAIAQVKDDLETEPTLFSPDWLSNYLTITETDINLIILDEIDSLWDDKKDNESELEELAEEYDLEDEFAYFYKEEQEDIDPKELKVKNKEELMQKIEDEHAKAIRTRMEEGLKNPYQYFVKDEGLYNLTDLMKASFISIDVDKAAKDAVNEEGIAHFLAGYDNNEIDLDDKLGFAYRQN